MTIIENAATFKSVDHRELLLGCGNRRTKRIYLKDDNDQWKNLTTLDIDPGCKPDVLFDLETLGTGNKLPFPDNHFDEIHAYEVLEHFGRQGDYKAFFAAFEDFWRVLKPGGLFFASVPHWESSWVWGDPGHTRQINKDSLIFLDQTNYRQIGETPMTDYRFCYSGDFECVATADDVPDVFKFVLLARKE